MSLSCEVTPLFEFEVCSCCSERHKSDKSAGGGGGKKASLKALAFCSLLMISSCNVGIYGAAGTVSIYRLTCQIVRSSASLTNVCHVILLASLIFALYFTSFIFHSLLSASRR